MSWLDLVISYLGAVASGDIRAVKQLVSQDVKTKMVSWNLMVLMSY